MKRIPRVGDIYQHKDEGRHRYGKILKIGKKYLIINYSRTWNFNGKEFEFDNIIDTKNSHTHRLEIKYVINNFRLIQKGLPECIIAWKKKLKKPSV